MEFQCKEGRSLVGYYDNDDGGGSNVPSSSSFFILMIAVYTEHCSFCFSFKFLVVSMLHVLSMVWRILL